MYIQLGPNNSQRLFCIKENNTTTVFQALCIHATDDRNPTDMRQFETPALAETPHQCRWDSL